MDILWARNLLRPADHGGSRYHWEVTRRLAARGNRMRVVVGRLGGPLPGPTAAQIIQYPISLRTPLHTFSTHVIFSQLEIRRQLRRRVPGVVVFSSYDVAFGHYAAPLLRPAVRTVFIYHSSFYSDAVRGVRSRGVPLRWGAEPLDRFVRSVERLTFRSADALIAVSPFSQMEMEQRLGGPDPRIQIIPTGVDTVFFAPGAQADARRRVELPMSSKVLLTVGRLASVKRYDRAIDAIALLRERDPSYVLVMAGTGPVESELRTRAAPLGDAVRFVGFADGEHLRDLYRAADMVLCTSEFENWSVALLEALSTGTPVIGTPRGSTPDLLRLVDAGLILRDVTPDAIAERVVALFGAAGAISQLGERARFVVAGQFSWDRTAEALENAIRKVAERS